MTIYIHQLPDWPAFRWDHQALGAVLTSVRHRQGRLIGRMEALGLVPRSEAVLTTLTQARKAVNRVAAYDDTLTRLKLKQAFARLVRRADDQGVFVMLDSRLPSRLKGAFPPGVEVQRIGHAEAIATVRGFLAPVPSDI